MSKKTTISFVVIIMICATMLIPSLGYVDPTVSSSMENEESEDVDKVDGGSIASSQINKQAVTLFKKYGWELGNVSFTEATAANVFTQKQWTSIKSASKKIGYTGKINSKTAKVYFYELLQSLDGEKNMYFRVFTVITDKRDNIIGACIVLRSNSNPILAAAFDGKDNEYDKELNKKWICNLKVKSKTMDSTMRNYYSQYK